MVVHSCNGFVRGKYKIIDLFRKQRIETLNYGEFFGSKKIVIARFVCKKTYKFAVVCLY